MSDPLEEARRRGLVFPRLPQKPETPPEPDHWSKPTLWILGITAAACLAAAWGGIPISFPFN
jgi:hypothetical protein